MSLYRRAGRRSLRSIQHPRRSTIFPTRHTTTSTPPAKDAQTTEPDLTHSDDLCTYTRGRFLHNEAHELAQRRITLNISALARHAADTIGAESCVRMVKYPDGMHSKSLLLTMNTGAQVVAKIPNPNAGPPHWTTASEVATMDFARTVLDTPVPAVLDWSADARANAVGAEYIVMEKAAGIELERVWPRMTIRERFAVVRAVAGFQKAWSSVAFRGFGSLYYAKDLAGSLPGEEVLCVDAEGKEVRSDRFAVGPSTGREWFDDGRGTVEFDRGPWRSLEAYHAAIGLREQACVTHLPQLPKSPVTLCGPGTYIPTRARKLQALDSYMKLFQVLLPTDPAITSGHLWHGDLHVANIFVDAAEPTKVTSLIDWQAAEIAPLYVQARQPHFMDYDGPPVHGLERPQLPEDLDRLEPTERKHAETLYLQQSLCVLYNTLTHRQNPRLWAALEFQHTPRYDLLLLARNLLIDGEATYLSLVAELEKTWHDLPGATGVPYPLHFAKEERDALAAEVEGTVRGMGAMRGIRESLGELFPEKGVVRPEVYEEARDALAQIKEQVIEEFARTDEEREVWREMWPFDG